MKLSDSIHIAASLDQVWPFVADPVGHATWNEKVIDVDRSPQRPLHVGEHFAMTYQMSGKPRQSDVEVLVCNPPTEVIFRHQYTWKQRRYFAEERFTLEQSGDQVKVTQYINMPTTGIPWVFRGLIWLISKIGRPVGKTTMQQLKEIVEGSIASPKAE